MATILAILYGVVLCWASSGLPYFWDSVALVSRPALYYYQQPQPSIWLPTLLDSGHPPFFAYYIALCWRVWGCTLAVSHAAVLPFWVLLAVSYGGVLRCCLPPNAPPTLPLLGTAMLITEPTLSTQTAFAAPDLALAAAALTALYGLLAQRLLLMAAALCLMVSLGLRGWIGVATIGVCHLLLYRTAPRQLLGQLWVYIGAALCAVAWLLLHHQHAGFWLENYRSNWADTYGYASSERIVRNIMVLLWRYTDAGRCILWLVVGVVAVYYLPSRHQQAHGNSNTTPKATNANWQRLSSCLWVWLLVGGAMVVFKEIPLMRRYYIVPYLLLGLWAVVLVAQLPQRWYRIAAVCLPLAQLSGHAWVYPPPIANDWDATLASLPYFGLRQQWEQYRQQHHIQQHEVYTYFPLMHSPKLTYLHPTDSTQLSRIYPHYTDTTQFRYVLYSNISNDFTPQQIQQLQRQTPLKTWQSGGIQLQLYGNISFKQK